MDFVHFIDIHGEKISVVANAISYIRWGGIDAGGELMSTDIYVIGKKRAIANIDHREPENQRSLEKLIPVSWECQVFDEWEELKR